MPQPLKDITGQQFGRTVAESHLGSGLWSVRCLACGSLFTAYGSDLRRKFSKGRSCGCMRSSFQADGRLKHGHSGEAAGPEYRAWKSIKVRCYNPKHVNFSNYGGKGVRVCDRWRDDFEAFLKDMGKRPGDGYSIERKDVHGHYEPSNCVWATSHVQSRNRTDNVLLTVDGRTQCLTDWAAESGTKRETISRRLSQGWPVERAIFEPPSEASLRGWRKRRAA